ncbi:hypothetical protein [Vibrio harveyi]|uniref:hypothetical protein n=1 Tax=Vibrio harveyi TaxID=669 RepID=UPI001263A6F3|nr:hypothetical protein [Vibrio harveyi]QFQ76884.1 hypothetical protein F9277_05150 [Vibrio harveyi]
MNISLQNLSKQVETAKTKQALKGIIVYAEEYQRSALAKHDYQGSYDAAFVIEKAEEKIRSMTISFF